jgi:hypothetical protein
LALWSTPFYGALVERVTAADCVCCATKIAHRSVALIPYFSRSAALTAPLPAIPATLDEVIKAQALDHLRELLDLRWREAWDSADEDGKFVISFKVAVTDGAPAKRKVTRRISTTITDAPSGASQPAKGSPRGSAGKSHPEVMAWDEFLKTNPISGSKNA